MQYHQRHPLTNKTTLCWYRRYPLSPMLFILVVDVLNAIVQKANDMVLLQPLTRHPLQHQVSLYADDMVTFLHPVATNIDLVMDTLRYLAQLRG
jgi:hypothetical protein